MSRSLRDSWAELTAAGPLAVRHFYATLFVLAPEVRPMFPASMTAQNDKLLTALGHLLTHVDNPDVLGAYAGRLGADHRRFAVERHHYPLVGQALLATLEHFLGPAFTPALRKEWTTAYQTIAHLMIDGAAQAATAQPPWRLAHVVHTELRTPDVRVFTVQPEQRVDYLPGQAIPVQGPTRDGWRPLSPANAPRPDSTTIEFHVRAVGGPFSLNLVRRLQPGDRIKLGTPASHGLADVPIGNQPVVMLAGGTGIASLRAILEGLAGSTRNPTTLVYGAPTPTDLYEHATLSRFAAAQSWLSYLPTVQLGRHWRGHHGTVADTAIRHTPWRHADILVCGSPAMTAATTRALLAAGAYPEQLHTDRPTPMDPPEAAAIWLASAVIAEGALR